MSRIRTVKPELFKHEDLFDAEQNSKLPLRLAFIGLFTIADCEGRFKWRPRTIKLDVLPHDFIDFAAVLDALERTGFIKRYEVDGESYGWIPTFAKHQRLQTKELTAGSSLPAPNGHDEPGTNQERYGERTGTHPEAQEGKGREEEGKGREEESAQAPCASPPAPIVAPVIATPATDTDTAKPAKAPKPGKAIKAPLPTDWTPAETTYALLAKQGMDHAFAESCLDEFRLYWQERGEARPGWEATFVNNVKRQWDHRPIQTTTTPHNGQRYTPPQAITPEGMKFDAILQNLNTQNRRPVIEGECYASH